VKSLLILLACVACGGARRAPDSMGPIPEATRQLVLVTTPGWQATEGTLTRWEREPGGAWRRAGEPIAVVVGRGGLGWGRGLHGAGAPAGREGPAKVEGDGRAPAGTFRLGAAYGYDDGDWPRYTRLGPSWVCVDDPASSRYNQVFDAAAATVDWKSAETMRRADELYRLLVVVEHNSEARPSGGSCIFLHVWSGPGSTTVGCTAMPLTSLDALARWLGPTAVYVALPEHELAALGRAWGLPEPR
jgi:L,D-peptidoglycan transpeptidase YkuD (ErfK/YbiS/YcfS/YnhG family)